MPNDVLPRACAFDHRPSIAVLALLLATSAPCEAWAATAPPPESNPATEHDAEEPEHEADPMLERAMAIYHRASENYALGRYEQALADFIEAATLYASPDFQYNIGLCYEKLGQTGEAIRAFEIYVRAKPNATDRAEVEARIAKLEAERKQQQAAREEQERLEQERLAAASSQPNRRLPLVVTGGVLTGLGVVVAAGAGIPLGLLASDRSDALDEIQQGGNPNRRTFAEANALEREGERFEIGQIASITVGSVIAVTGVALLAVGLRQRKPSDARARLAPSWHGRQAGLVLHGRF